MAPNAIGVGSAQASRSISSGPSAATRSRKRSSASCRIGRPVPDGPGRCGPVGARVAPAVVADRSPHAAFAVVARPQLRIAQPVVGDVDPLGSFEPVGPGDVGMMLAEERSPGDLDDLRARIDGDLEAGVEVVGGERRTGRHGPNPTGARPGPRLDSADGLREASAGGSRGSRQPGPVGRGHGAHHGRGSGHPGEARAAGARRHGRRPAGRLDGRRADRPERAGRPHRQGHGAPGDDQLRRCARSSRPTASRRSGSPPRSRRASPSRSAGSTMALRA